MYREEQALDSLMKQKIKQLLPSLREKKRYMVYEVISENSINRNSIVMAIDSAVHSFIGDLGMAHAGLIHLDDWKNNKGIIRVNHKEVNNVKAALSLLSSIGPSRVIFKNIYVSGILNKARIKLSKEEA
jgi:ribonuclease P/MRP protein subunit POP5